MAVTSVALQGQIWYIRPEVPDDVRTAKTKKVRPWIIISPDKYNFIQSGYIVLPITHSHHIDDPFKIEIDCPTKPGAPYSKSWIVTYKPRLVDEKDLINYVGAANRQLVNICIDKLHEWLKGEVNVESFDEDLSEDEDSLSEDDYELSDEESFRSVVESKDPMSLTDEELEEYGLSKGYRYFSKFAKMDIAKIQNSIKLYSRDKRAFMNEFSISERSARILVGELKSYLDSVK